MFRFSGMALVVAPTQMLLNKGKVISWMTGRGFGFAEDASDQKQHFVHFSALKTEPGGYRGLSVGQEIEYDVVSADGRTRAENVTGPGGSPLPSGPRPPEGFGGGGGAPRGGRGGGFGGGRGGGDGGYRGGGGGGGGGYQRGGGGGGYQRGGGGGGYQRGGGGGGRPFQSNDDF